MTAEYNVERAAYRRQLRYAHFDKQCGSCAYCGVSMRKKYAGKNKQSLTLEHIIPCKYFRLDVKWNTAGVCLQCNTLRGSSRLSKEQLNRLKELKGLSMLPIITILKAITLYEEVKYFAVYNSILIPVI